MSYSADMPDVYTPSRVHRSEFLNLNYSYAANGDVLTAQQTATDPHDTAVTALELLRRGSGPMRDLLEDLGAWDATAVPHGTRPLGYLRLLAGCHRALVVHGNYLDDEEIAFLGERADSMAAVYCPRSHDWFAHRDYPLGQMLAAGVAVAVGTDGRGSSPDECAALIWFLLSPESAYMTGQAINFTGGLVTW